MSTVTPEAPLTIVRLTMENLKGITAVEIVPDPEGNLVIVSGPNGAGKSSVLDGIWLVLGGPAAKKQTPQPIRAGETSAHAVLDLGDFTATRWWYGDGTSKLTVMSKDGAVYKSAQAFLDAKIGALSFDPFGFTRKSAREQLEDLLELVDLPFDPLELQAERDLVYGRRTEIGRTVTELEGQLAGAGDFDDVPDEEISMGEILDQITAAEQLAAANSETRRLHAQAVSTVESRTATVLVLQRQLYDAQERLTGAIADAAETREKVEQIVEAPDVSSFREQLAGAEEINAQVRAKQERNRVASQHEEASESYASLTRSIEAIDERKKVAVAEAKMPVEGLSFDENGVMFDGVPFGQCSSAQQLRVSLAMGMAMNPRIGVLLIKDGSLLDKTSLALIREMAVGYQVWIEQVTEPGAGVGFEMSEGAVIDTTAEVVSALEAQE